MPSPSASVHLEHLSWSAPDARHLFDALSLSFGPGRTGIVGRNGSGKTTLLRLIAGHLQPASGRIIVTGSLGWMQQDVAAHPKLRLATLFGVAPALDVLARAEAGCATTRDLAEADWTLPARMQAALGRVGLDLPCEATLDHLSGGQRSRAALAALLFQAPDILLLDEPTNNLDTEGRAAVREVLRGWRGTALVVSHDRVLLEEMDAIVELTAQGATRTQGPYSRYRAERQAALATAHHDLAEATKLRRETARRAQEAAERKARRDSAGKAARATGSQPKVLLDKAQERAEASKGAGVRLRQARAAAAEEALEDARTRIEVLEPIRMQIPPCGLMPSQRVLQMTEVTASPDVASPVVASPDVRNQEITSPVLRDLSLQITGPERIAVTGANGSGKTTLLRVILGRLAPIAGDVDLRVDPVLLDQHVGLLAPEQTLAANYHRLNPKATATEARAALAQFRFRAEDGDRVAGQLSSGQRLRAGLACTLGRLDPPQLLLLDEPTNHLDLDATEALEAALRAYDGALIVVSHDQAFLDQLMLTRRIDLSARGLSEKAAG